jgi:phosphoribosylglycinamide formyltransferase-1
MPDPFRIVALVSGGGTTLQNLIDRAADGRLAAQIAGVVSSRADAFGVERAKRAGLPVTVVERSRGGRQPPEIWTNRVWDAVRGFAPDLVCLAGWLHLLPIPDDFRLKVLNIHPALLPAFGGKGMYGRHVHEAVLAYGAKVSGCTVHFADDTYDTGPILVQRCVPVKAGDDPDTLAARVFQAECEAYPEAIGLLAAGRVTVQGRRVVVS